MTSTATRVKPMKDIEVLSDPEVIKLLFEKTRSAIVFRYLSRGAMTVKQLSDALNKNPGTILHHIEKLKKNGIIIEERTEVTPTGIVQKYYRTTAREYRFGLSRMMESNNGVSKFAKDRFVTMIKSLSVFGINVKDQDIEGGVKILQHMIERENHVISNLPISNQKIYNDLPVPVRVDASRLMRRYALDKDAEYNKSKQKWFEFLTNKLVK